MYSENNKPKYGNSILQYTVQQYTAVYCCGILARSQVQLISRALSTRIHSTYLGGGVVKIEMRQKAAASHTLLNRHLGECIPPPQSPRVPPGTRPPTLQKQEFLFLDGWREVGGTKVVQIRPQTTHRAQETHLTGPYNPEGPGRVPSARQYRSWRLGAPRRPRRC